jgi:hypothetical protein
VALTKAAGQIISSLLGFVAVVAIAVAVGVTVSNDHHKKSVVRTSNSSTPTSSSISPSQTSSSGPSSFTKDPRLKRSFYGLAYTPGECCVCVCVSKHKL